MTAAVLLLTSQFTRCVDLPGFMTVLDDETNLTSSLQEWTGSFCSKTCSPAVLSSANDTVMLGCSTDIAMNTSELPLLVLMAIQHYDFARHLACAETVGTHENCYVTMVRNLEQANNARYTVRDVLSLGRHLDLFETLSTAQLCSDCNKVIFKYAEQAVTNQTMRENLLKMVQSRCNASFIDGAQPATVSFIEGVPSPTSSRDDGGTSGGSASNSDRPPGMSHVRGTPTSDGDPVITLRMQLASFAVVVVAALLGGVFVL
ncbi:BQ2448_4648 [Microbotryum intermedium]|uniref:BQ2448_4648 protein n=1 Tax=Microbotryum intermedium TaxID=269621 RepID=A0A238FJ91_9BASI|nr:BQ2448_4648 [Microbotryum intermedium]